MDLSRYSHIIWDWNGTLLNDAWLCVDVMNSILTEYHLPLVTLKQYREIFDFPVKEYYLKLGFDFNVVPFEEVGMEFMNRYNARHTEAELYPEAENILSFIQHKGLTQSILSAREQNELRTETEKLSVMHYFLAIYGLDDHFAHGKRDVGFRLLSALSIPVNKLLFIGDTLHDAEVAKEIGVDCILIPNGHHSHERIQQAGIPCFSSISEIEHHL